jgi:hypothetical protein
VPLRLTISEATLSGHNYDDVLGVRYEFPLRYRNLVREGERFVYYRGRRQLLGGVQPQAYLGTGIVGNVHASTRDPQRLVCEIEDWLPFVEPLYFKDATGNYYEPGGKQGGYYWQVGVRLLAEGTYERILLDAGALERERASAKTTEAESSRVFAGTAYPSAEHRQAIDDYAMNVALRYATQAWRSEPVSRQPHNNRGFDIRVGAPTRVVRYVEVKGTALPVPRFFMSEGERLFSTRAASKYTLLIIYAIDLKQAAHKLLRHDGSVTNQRFTLTPYQWSSEARVAEAGPS